MRRSIAIAEEIHRINNPIVRVCGFTPINMINNGKCYEIAVAFVMIHIFKIYFGY